MTWHDLFTLLILPIGTSGHDNMTQLHYRYIPNKHQVTIHKIHRWIHSEVINTSTLYYQVYLVSICVKGWAEWSSTWWRYSHFISSILAFHHWLWESFRVCHLVQMKSKMKWPPASWWLCPVWVADSLATFLTSAGQLTQKLPISRDHNSTIGMAPLEVNHMPHLWIEENSSAG